MQPQPIQPESGQLLPNLVICVPGIGSMQPFSTLIVDHPPDLGLLGATQMIPRWRYEPKGSECEPQAEDWGSHWRIDNISDQSLADFQTHYGIDISKDDIFYYTYGVFHAPQYRERFANDLRKSLPRIPFAPDFHSFAKAGAQLAYLHLDYDAGDIYPLKVHHAYKATPAERYRLTEKRMRWMDDRKSSLMINMCTSVSGIPPEATEYRVNGRSPIEWAINQLRVKTHKESGIINDPNLAFDDPKEIIDLIGRRVHIGVESVRIIDRLPDPFRRSL